MPKLSEVIFQNLSDGFDNCTSVDDRSASRTKMRKMALSMEAARCPIATQRADHPSCTGH
jgi:hypothetical protein